MNYFTMGKLPMTLLIAGLAMNALDTITAKNGSGGVLFGPTGFLKGIDESLPDTNVPGTDIRINLGGYLVALGGAWMLVNELK